MNKIIVSKPMEVEASNLPGKRWKQKRDQKYGLVGSFAISARLRVSLQGLERGIPAESKPVLVQTIQRYLAKEISPEQFAESIQTLVDDFNVVVPSGPTGEDAARQPQTESKKRPAEETKTSPTVRAKPAKRARVQPMPAPAPAPAPVPVKQEGEATQSAWDALISVCSRM